MNAVGIQRTFVPSGVSLTNAGDVQSHAVYPLAAAVERSPPEGKEEASGSARSSSFPESSIITEPSLVPLIKESCFSAVPLFSGWNQCV